jgi:hypothetical protein
MSWHEATDILLVRAVEETAPELISGESLLEAELEAGPLDDLRGWFARRAEVLVARLPAAYQTLPSMTRAVFGSGRPIFAAAVLLGVGSNYLGPSQKIHVLYNPIVLLLFWNIAMYLVLGAGRLLRRERAPQPRRRATVAHPRRPEPPDPPRVGLLARWLFGRSVPALWSLLHRPQAHSDAEVRTLSRVARRFWSEWLEVSQPLLGAASARALHVGAIGLGLGAALGMFVRGLFFEYDVVWRSTFISDPRTVESILGGLFALPALLVGDSPPSGAAVAALLGPDGVPADRWIWIYASAVAFFIVVPRSLLAWAESRRLRMQGRALDLHLNREYFTAIIEQARAMRTSEIEAFIGSDVRIEAAKFAEGLASFVCDALYDRRIAERLRAFAANGGRLSELELEIANECEQFQSELEAALPRAQTEFQQALVRAVRQSIAEQVEFAAEASADLGSDLRAASQASASRVGDALSTGVGDAVGAAVSAAAAAGAGILSGGFGSKIGIAVLTGLLHTTGPVGFVVGAASGLVVAGGSYVAGRKRVGQLVKTTALPSALTRLLLSQKRIESGRAQCHDGVRRVIDEKLDTLAPEISDEIWRQVRPLLAARHRRTEA